MRRSLTLTAIILAGASLSGCAQLSSVGNWISQPFRGELRDAPKPDWEVAETTETVTEVQYVEAPATYTTSTTTTQTFTPSTSSIYYNATGPFYGVDEPWGQTQRVAVAPPQSLSYVRLNGESRMSDWQACEALHNGYWRIDAAGGRIDPGFEVCMRNKGYVRESELAMYGFDMSDRVVGGSMTARSAGYSAGSFGSGSYTTGTYGTIN